MSKESPLSHHEQLRYDYLFKNIHYLNDREKREFDYLKRKMDGESPSNEREKNLGKDIGIPQYSNQSRSNRHQKFSSLPKVKKKKPRRFFKRVLIWLLLLITCVAAGMIIMFLRGFQSATTSNKPADAKAAQVEVFNGQDTKDGVNILIMGTDGRIGQNSAETRTDTIMVLNVSGSDKKIKLVSFMRDNLVYIDGYSQIVNGKKQRDNKLNVAYELGEQEGQKGAEMVRKVLKDNFDLDIKYYALVDFQAFATAIDTLFPDGVTIDAQFSTLNGQPLTEVAVGDDLHATETESPTQTIRAGKQQSWKTANEWIHLAELCSLP